MTILMCILLILLGFLFGIDYERCTGDLRRTKLERKRDKEEFPGITQRLD